MYLKIHSGPEGLVVALCDASLIGRILSDGKIRLDLGKHGDFYKGRLVSEEEAVGALKGAVNANIVGSKSLECARKAELEITGAIFIEGIPHLQVYKV